MVGSFLRKRKLRLKLPRTLKIKLQQPNLTLRRKKKNQTRKNLKELKEKRKKKKKDYERLKKNGMLLMKIQNSIANLKIFSRNLA